MEMLAKILWHIILRNTCSCIFKIVFSSIKNSKITKFYIFIFLKQLINVTNDLSYRIRINARLCIEFRHYLITIGSYALTDPLNLYKVKIFTLFIGQLNIKAV